jgi:predicted  nucleic acid-binding Zn-ribbon protein
MKTTLGKAMVAIGLVLAGCGNQQARIEQNQRRLPAMIAVSRQQITCIAPGIKQNQQELQTEISTVDKNAQLVAADIAAVSDAQMKMQEALVKNNQNLPNTLPIVDQHQHNLRIEIRDVQSSMQAAAGRP